MQLRNAAVQVRSRGIIILKKDGLLKGCVMANHEEGLIHHLYVHQTLAVKLHKFILTVLLL